jgi:PAS domain S-box-containing protein
MWRKPSLGAAIGLCVLVAVAVVLLRFTVLKRVSIPIGFAVPIAIAGVARRRWLIWGVVVIFLGISVAKFVANYSNYTPAPRESRVLTMILVTADLLVMAVLMDLLARKQDAYEARGQELERASELIENEQKRLQTIVDTVPFGIVTTDANFTHLSCNPAGAAMLGFPASLNMPRDTWPKVKVFGPQGEIERGQDPLTLALQGQSTAQLELELRFEDGRILTALCSAAPILNRSGEISEAIAAFVDVSALKSLRQEQERRRQQAEDESARKSRFLAAVSHDIRTPVNAIGLLAEYIQNSADDPEEVQEIPQIAQELRRSAINLVSLVSDVLDLTRLDLGRFDLRPTEFEMNEWLMDECNDLRPLADEKQLKFDFRGADSTVRLRGDRIKLSRVVTNLVGNAIKFTESGQVEVKAALLPDRRPRVSVRDTGIGIASENLTKIFDEFAQLKNPERDKSRGSGLGLSISKRLVEAMGGSLDVVSEPGKGSTFSFTLPASSVVE